MSVQATPLIQCKGLKKVYAGQDAPSPPALAGVNLAVRQGEFLILMGASGSGKSTLLYLLSGLERASEGSIRLDDSDVDRMNETELALMRRAAVGFVFQGIHLVPHFTILENLLVPGYLVSRDRPTVLGRAQQLLDDLGVGHLTDRLPSQVSGGEQQRVAIARALINSPSVLFADEPTGALNSSSGKAVLDSFRHIHEQGQTIAMATHDVRAACHGDRVVYLRDGEVVGEMRFPESDAKTFSQKTVSNREPQLVEWLAANGW